MKSNATIRIACYLFVYLGVPIIASQVTNLTVVTVIGLVYLFLLIPFGIVRMIDFYRMNDGTTLFARIFNTLFRLPLALFGLVCLVTGIAIIVWVLYNVFLERQKEYTGPRFVFGLGSFGIGGPLVLYGWLTLWSAVRRQEEVTLGAEEQEESDREEKDDWNTPPR